MWEFIFDCGTEAELFLKLFKDIYSDIHAEFNDLYQQSVAVHIELFPSYERLYMPRKLISAFVAMRREWGRNLCYILIPSKNRCLIFTHSH